MPLTEKLRIEPTMASATDYLQKLLNTYDIAQTGPSALQRDAKHVIAVWLDAIVEGEASTEEKIQFLRKHLESNKGAPRN